MLGSAEPVGYGVICPSNARRVVLNGVIELIERSLWKKAPIKRRPLNPADIPATWAEISRAKSFLGWQP